MIRQAACRWGAQLFMITAVCAAIWGLAAVAQAEAPPVEKPQLSESLVLDAGASCLDHDRLVERVMRWREFADVDASLRVRVRGDAHEPTRIFFSVVRAGIEPTERTLDNAPEDCDQLHSAVALSIALAIDALLSSERQPPLPAAEAKSERNRPAPSFNPEPSGPGLYVELALLAGASVGVLPDTAVVLVPRLQITPLPWLAVSAAGIFTTAENLNVGSAPGRYDAAMLAIGLDGCAGGETTERFSFFMCVGARGGGFATNGYGFENRQRSTRRWWAVAASGQARAWILKTVGIGVSVEALFALAARDLVATSADEEAPPQVRTLSRFGISVSGGPVFRFF